MSDVDWTWMALVDPVAVEKERFNVTAHALRRREGVHLGMLHDSTPDVDVRIIRALTREREREDRERHRIEVRGEMLGRIRELRAQLERERRSRAKAEAWRQKLTTWGHLPGGPSSLESA